MRQFINIVESASTDMIQEIVSHMNSLSAIEWTQRNLRNWLDRGGQADVLRHPSDLAKFIDQKYGSWKFDRLARISAPDMMQAYRTANKPSNRSLKGRNSHVANMMGNENASIEPGRNAAEWYINIGPNFRAHVGFRSGGNNIYERGWAVMKTPTYNNTGLFPRINACLQVITEKFIKDVKPNLVFLHGADVKRNIWNAKVYRNFDAQGYRFFLMKADPLDHSRATPEGVVAVGWAKDGFDFLRNGKFDGYDVEFIDS